MTPHHKKTYMAEVDKIRYDILCEGCGNVMVIDNTFDTKRVDPLIGKSPAYKYDCESCDFHTITPHRFPLFLAGWKGRKGDG